jgi:hypothetical protein
MGCELQENLPRDRWQHRRQVTGTALSEIRHTHPAKDDLGD